MVPLPVVLEYEQSTPVINDNLILRTQTLKVAIGEKEIKRIY